MKKTFTEEQIRQYFIDNTSESNLLDLQVKDGVVLYVRFHYSYIMSEPFPFEVQTLDAHGCTITGIDDVKAGYFPKNITGTLEVQYLQQTTLEFLSDCAVHGGVAIKDCKSLTSLRGLPSTTKVRVERCPSLTSLEGIHPKLAYLACADLQITHLANVHLEQYAELVLHRCSELITLDGLTGAAELIKVEIQACEKLTDLKALKNLSYVRRVGLNLNTSTLNGLPESASEVQLSMPAYHGLYKLRCKTDTLYLDDGSKAGTIGAAVLGAVYVSDFGLTKVPSLLNKCIYQGASLVDAQEALIDAGYEEAAEL